MTVKTINEKDITNIIIRFDNRVKEEFANFSIAMAEYLDKLFIDKVTHNKILLDNPKNIAYIYM